MQNQTNPSDLGIPLAQETKLPTPAPLCAFTKFNDLPQEIQRSIFEIAYRLTECDRSNEWVYASRKVREWIDPLIYEAIVLPEDFGGGDMRLKLYERTFRSKPKEFYTRSVRRVFTNNSLKHKSSDFELELLQICDNLVSLECWSDAREELSAILRTKAWSSLKILCINIDLLPKDENTFHLPLFKYVTHLDFRSAEPQLPSWESLKCLDNLSHMRVDMLDGTEIQHFRLAMDQTYAIATKAQKCFPPNLKYFVISVSVGHISLICNMEHETSDKQRWERMESLRLGSFDPRIMLGCSGDWENWYGGGELPDVGMDGIDNLICYTDFVPVLSYLYSPRDHLDEEEKDTWVEVSLGDRERKEFLARL